MLAPQHGLTGGMEQMTSSCSACTLNHEGIDVRGMCDDVISPPVASRLLSSRVHWRKVCWSDQRKPHAHASGRGEAGLRRRGSCPSTDCHRGWPPWPSPNASGLLESPVTESGWKADTCPSTRRDKRRANSPSRPCSSGGGVRRTSSVGRQAVMERGRLTFGRSIRVERPSMRPDGGEAAGAGGSVRPMLRRARRAAARSGESRIAITTKPPGLARRSTTPFGRLLDSRR